MHLDFVLSVLSEVLRTAPTVVTIQTIALEPNMMTFKLLWNRMEKYLKDQIETAKPSLIQALFLQTSQVMVGCAFLLSDIELHNDQASIKISSQPLMEVLSHALEAIYHIKTLDDSEAVKLSAQGVMFVALILSQLFCEGGHHEFIDMYANEVASDNFTGTISLNPNTETHLGGGCHWGEGFIHTSLLNGEPDIMDNSLTSLIPNYKLKVWKYQYGDDIILHSPQELLREHSPTLFRQVNSGAKGKVWMQEYTEKHLTKVFGEETIDNADGVIVCNGKGESISQQRVQTDNHHQYSRGQRVWIQNGFPLESNDTDKISVVDLESRKNFRIPHEHLCFVPRFAENDGSMYHVAIGPMTKTFMQKGKSLQRLYFSWHVNKPSQVTHRWVKLKDKGDNRPIRSLIELEADDQQRAFEMQWKSKTEYFTRLGILTNEISLRCLEDTLDVSSRKGTPIES